MVSNAWPMKDYIFLREPGRVTCEEFYEMRVRNVLYEGRPNTVYRCLLHGRWHAVVRSYSCGLPVLQARPLICVVPAELRQ